MVKIAFSSALFLSAFLLFSIQPMVAKMLLPIFGGTPAVWTVCMLFFQVLLLAAYGYAWCLSQFKKVWNWKLTHLTVVLLSLFALPLKQAIVSMHYRPELAILQTLIQKFSIPLFVLGASAPLLQFAYSQTREKEAEDPYFLYAASNCGSFLALLSYPFLLERFIGLNKLFHYWNNLYLVYLLLLGLIFLGFYFKPLPKEDSQSVPGKQKLLWIAYSFIPCSLMLGVTFYISTDIAATPLFWIVPLALYLLSFIITFAKKPLISQRLVEQISLFALLFPMLGFIFGSHAVPALELIGIHLSSFFIIALLSHGKLVASRPKAQSLTSFYFCLSIGGAIAGLFNGLIAPHIFNTALEYPLVLLFAFALLPLNKKWSFNFVPLILGLFILIDYFLPNEGASIAALIKKYHILPILGLALAFIWPKSRVNLILSMAILLFSIFSSYFKPTTTLAGLRNFYGVKQVLLAPFAHVLMSQSTIHGYQLIEEPRLLGTVAYYGPTQGVIKSLKEFHPILNATIIGLGTGLMACQFAKEDNLHYIDIDDQVISIAKNPQFFTYLSECPPKISVEEADGRLALKEIGQKNNLLVLDAFSSDAIPTHLLTLEAFLTYQNAIKEDGAILVHISNRHLNLLPVLIAAAKHLDLIVLKKFDNGNATLGQFASEWVLLTANSSLANLLMSKENWKFAIESGYLWTDDYSNLLPLLK